MLNMILNRIKATSKNVIMKETHMKEKQMMQSMTPKRAPKIQLRTEVPTKVREIKATKLHPARFKPYSLVSNQN